MIKFVLAGASTSLTTKEIVEEVMKLEPSADRTKIMRSMSSVLSVGSSGENVVYLKTQNERNENTFLLK